MKTLRNRPFKVDLFTCFIGLICLTVLIVIYSYETNSKNTIKLVKELAKSTLNHAVSQTIQQINIAQYTPALTSSLLFDKLDIINDKQLENHIITVLQQNNFLYMYYIGDEKGNFITGYRNKYNNISTKKINRMTKTPFGIWKYRNEKGVVYKENKEINPDFDPRLRPWYLGVKKSLQPYWTETYKFYNNGFDNAYINKTTDVYGISISQPILNDKNKLLGVVGADISLNNLSDFLSSLKIGENGKILMVSKSKQLILYPLVHSEKLISTPQQPGMRIEDIEIDWLREGLRKFFHQPEHDFFYRYQDQDYFFRVHDFSNEIAKPWYLIIGVPVEDFLFSIKQNRLINLSITCFMLLLSILFSLGLSRSLSRPLEKMSQTMRQVNQLDFANLTPLKSAIREFQQMSDALNVLIQGLKAFLKYVPSTVVEQLIKKGEDATLGGQELNLSIFFSDIENFTEIAEDCAPLEVMADLTHYFDQMVRVIVNQNHGTLDKFIGDSVMAFWNEVHYPSDYVRLACQAALQCQLEINQLNHARIKAKKRPFTTRIGIHAGSAIVGNIGSSDRFNYTIIGDNVNLASRLEGLNKLYGTGILVSHTTYRQTYQFFVFRPLDFVMVKGKNEGMKVYQLLAEKDHCEPQVLALAEQASEAFRYYLAKNFKLALKMYLRILAHHPTDKPAKVMIEKCQKFIEVPPNENWTGATRVFDKL